MDVPVYIVAALGPGLIINNFPREARGLHVYGPCHDRANKMDRLCPGVACWVGRRLDSSFTGLLDFLRKLVGLYRGRFIWQTTPEVCTLPPGNRGPTRGPIFEILWGCVANFLYRYYRGIEYGKGSEGSCGENVDDDIIKSPCKRIEYPKMFTTKGKIH